MKKALSLLFAILFVSIFMLQLVLFADEAEREKTRNNNVLYTSTEFSILSLGTANVAVEYVGMNNVTTGATIEITI